MNVLSVVTALMVGAGIILLFRALAAGRRPDLIEARLASYSDHPLSLEQIELQAPFLERTIKPVLERLGEAMSNRTPQARRNGIQNRINLAGRPGNLDVNSFLALKLSVAVVLGGLLFLLSPLIGLAFPANLLGALIGGPLGFYIPEFWLNSRVKRRKREVLLALPNALDLLTIAVEAGLGFDAALSRVTDKYHNALSAEFAQVLREVRLGRPRMEALDDMGRRSGVEELHNFVQALIQSEQLGVGIAKILRIQSEEMRRKRRQRAEEKAAQATLKMMLPMVGCIFPTIFIVLLGPAAILLKKSFAH
ncbi:MAG: type II secretion system F family protein [Candidatus Dormibacteria bacterium]